MRLVVVILPLLILCGALQDSSSYRAVVELTDGTTLRGEVTEVAGGLLLTNLAGKVRISNERVASVKRLPSVKPAPQSQPAPVEEPAPAEAQPTPQPAEPKPAEPQPEEPQPQPQTEEEKPQQTEPVAESQPVQPPDAGPDEQPGSIETPAPQPEPAPEEPSTDPPPADDDQAEDSSEAANDDEAKDSGPKDGDQSEDSGPKDDDQAADPGPADDQAGQTEPSTDPKPETESSQPAEEPAKDEEVEPQPAEPAPQPNDTEQPKAEEAEPEAEPKPEPEPDKPQEEQQPAEQPAPTEPVAIKAEPVKPKPTPPVRLSNPPRLSAKDQLRLKLSELSFDDSERVTVRFTRSIQGTLPSIIARRLEAPFAAAGERQPGLPADIAEDIKTLQDGRLLDQLEVIRRRTGLEFVDQIQLRGETRVLGTFRRQVLPYVMRGCARSGCHGGPTAQRFRLPNSNSESDALAAFVILDGVTTSNGRLINRERPDDSRLLDYLLPDDETANPHPQVRRGVVQPLIKSRADNDYNTIIDWIRTLRKPRPNYELETSMPDWLR